MSVGSLLLKGALDGTICPARVLAYATQRRAKLCRVNAPSTSLRQTHAA